METITFQNVLVRSVVLSRVALTAQACLWIQEDIFLLLLSMFLTLLKSLSVKTKGTMERKARALQTPIPNLRRARRRGRNNRLQQYHPVAI